MKGWINPLLYLDLDDASHENILTNLCLPSTTSDIRSIKERYKEITQSESSIPIAPAENRILQNIIWPLKHAKDSYCIENYLGTIALCGMVAEMLAMLIFEVYDIAVNSYPVNKNADIQKGLFGKTFEKLGQERRVNILLAYEVINTEDQSKFDLIRKIRNKYLHFYSYGHKSIKSDALGVYSACTALFNQITGLKFNGGVTEFNKPFRVYFKQKGII